MMIEIVGIVVSVFAYVVGATLVGITVMLNNEILWESRIVSGLKSDWDSLTFLTAFAWPVLGVPVLLIHMCLYGIRRHHRKIMKGELNDEIIRTLEKRRQKRIRELEHEAGVVNDQEPVTDRFLRSPSVHEIISRNTPRRR